MGGCKGGGFLEPPLRFLFGTPFLFSKRNGVEEKAFPHPRGGEVAEDRAEKKPKGRKPCFFRPLRLKY